MSADSNCPCLSGRAKQQCCAPILAGQPATSPEALMRSRFTAYAVGDVDHIIATTHPTSPHQEADLIEWRREIATFSTGTRFTSLTIHDSGEHGLKGWVRFTAGLNVGGIDQRMHEHSIFFRLGARWLYHSARTS